MFPDDLPLCGNCGLDEITHDQTADHDFVAVGGGRTVPRPFSMLDIAPPSKFRANAYGVFLFGLASWAMLAGMAWAVFDAVR